MKGFLILLAALVLCSCSVQQRRYQRGFHVEWHGKERGSRPTASARPHVTRNAPVVITKSAEEPLVASAGEPRLSPQAFVKSSRTGLLVPGRRTSGRQADPDTCDLLVMKNGQEIRSRILEIGPTEIRYNKCDVGSAVYVSHKKDVLMIRYANGSREVFDTSPAPPSPRSSAPAAGKKNHPDSELVLILAILGWVLGIGSIPAIVIGNKALKDIRARPDLYKNDDIIQFSIVISWIKLALLAVSLLFLIMIFSMV